MPKKQKEIVNQAKNEVVVNYEIGSTVKNGVDFIGDFYLFNPKELQFLEEFAKDLNPTRVCRDMGYKEPEAAAQRFLDIPQIRVECKAIYDARFKALQMTQEMAAAKHISLMQKFEKDYDQFDDGNKAKMANALSKFSGDYLRAAGLFGKESKQTPNVVINLNIADKEKGIVIDGKAE